MDRWPGRAALLASLPPGLGHLRERNWNRGLSLLLGSLFLLYVALNPAHYAIPPPPWGLGLIGAGLALLLWLYAARDLERGAGGGAGRGRATGRPSASSRPGRAPRSR